MTQKILVAEDEIHIRTLLRRTFEMSFEDLIEDDQLEILEVSTGDESVRVAKKEHPALIFLDVMMPIMDGYEACQKIKEDPNLSESYIIMLTAKGQEVDKSKGVESGANEYITKPFDPDQLILKAETLLNIKRSS